MIHNIVYVELAFLEIYKMEDSYGFNVHFTQ